MMGFVAMYLLIVVQKVVDQVQPLLLLDPFVVVIMLNILVLPAEDVIEI